MQAAMMTTAESGGPARAWTAVLSRAALKAKDDPAWRAVPLEPCSADLEAFRAVYSDRGIPQAAVKDAYPDHWTALHWYMAEYRSSTRWPLEAWLLTGMDPAEVAAKVDPSAPLLAVDIYRRAFFNVDQDRKNNPGWMHRYIWGPGMSHRTSRYYYDFFLKAVAFYKGADTLDRILGGDALGERDGTMLRELATGLRDRLVLAESNAFTALPMAERALLVDSAMAAWRAETPPPPPSNPILDDLADEVRRRVGVLMPGTDQEETYEFTSEKYEDPQ